MRYRNAKYDYSEASKIDHIIPDEFCDSLDIKSYSVKAKHKRGRRVKRRAVRNVFFDFLNVLIEELMEKNHRFVSPTREYFVLFIKEKSYESIRRIYKNGIYQDVDPIQSEGKIYEFFIHFHVDGRVVRRPVRISYKKYKELIERVNKGQRYFR